jgi:hypothetical protein
MEDGQLLIQTFCSKREYKCVSYCHDWIRMNWPQEDLDFSEQNSSYFKTQIGKGYCICANFSFETKVQNNKDLTQKFKMKKLIPKLKVNDI